MYNLKFITKYNDLIDYRIFIANKRTNKIDNTFSLIIQLIPVSFILFIVLVTDSNSISKLGILVVLLFISWFFYNIFNYKKRIKKSYENL